jgi:hypothetical protein
LKQEEATDPDFYLYDCFYSYGPNRFICTIHNRLFRAGLPDGVFSNQKIEIWVNFEDVVIFEDVVVFY